MKKLLVLALALSATAAFAKKKLVSIDGETLSHAASYTMETLEYDATGTNKEEEDTDLSINVNMAWEVQSKLYVGGILNFGKRTVTNTSQAGVATDTDIDTLGYGLRVVYEVMGSGKDAGYVDFRYVMTNVESKTGAAAATEEDTTDITIGFAKRMAYANLAGANVAWTPGIYYTMRDVETSPTANGFDSGTEIKINIVNFDIMF